MGKQLFSYSSVGMGFPDRSVVKNPPTYQCRGCRRYGFSPWVGMAWYARRAWQPTPVFLPGESYGQRSLVGYSPWGCKESDMTDHACIFMQCGRISWRSASFELNNLMYIPCFFLIYFWLEDNCFTRCVGFCHTTTWISCKYTNIHSLLNLPSTPTPSHPARLRIPFNPGISFYISTHTCVKCLTYLVKLYQ